jgi:23S rRNA (adenine2503-C2)-methyltransferase
VLAAADAYFHRTGRQVTYEYVLLGGVNDRSADARALARLLATRQAHVNLIPYNPVAGLPFARPDARGVSQFAAILREGKVSVTVRKTKGRAIDAACGQLRRRLARDHDRVLELGHDVEVGLHPAPAAPGAGVLEEQSPASS